MHPHYIDRATKSKEKKMVGNGNVCRGKLIRNDEACKVFRVTNGNRKKIKLEETIV